METALELSNGWERFEVHARNMDVKGSSGEVSDENKNMYW